jgi:hypothetical protein
VSSAAVTDGCSPSPVTVTQQQALMGADKESRPTTSVDDVSNPTLALARTRTLSPSLTDQQDVSLTDQQDLLSADIETEPIAAVADVFIVIGVSNTSTIPNPGPIFISTLISALDLNHIQIQTQSQQQDLLTADKETESIAVVNDVSTRNRTLTLRRTPTPTNPSSSLNPNFFKPQPKLRSNRTKRLGQPQ